MQEVSELKLQLRVILWKRPCFCPSLCRKMTPEKLPFAAFISRCIVLVQITGTHNAQRGLNQQMKFVCKVTKVTDTSALQIVLLVPRTRWSPEVPQLIILMFAWTISTLPGLGTPDLISLSAALTLS